MLTKEEMMANPRWFIDKHGVYQTNYKGFSKLAHDSWVKSNSWGLTRDDIIRLSYYHGNFEHGSDGSGPVNGSEDLPEDAVYISADGNVMTRSMVSYWFSNCNSYMHGYVKALEENTKENT